MFNRKRKNDVLTFRVMSPLRYAVIVIGALALNAALFSGIYAQVNNPGVQQSGAVTAGHCVKWGPGLGQISDNGANCAAAITPANATSANDTNVTLTLTGTPTGALLQAVQWQMGWTGTLAAARLNSNVVQSFVNDTNVTASILNQVATLGWSGTLAITRGGTGASSAAAAISALMPTPTRAGDIAFWNGTNWVTLAGNNSGTQVLSENASGVPAWSAAGTGTVTTLTAGTNISFSSGATCTTTCTVNFSGTIPAGANPTATASDVAVNGVSTSFMRADAAPAVQKATNAQFGIMEGDNVTVTCSAGVCGQKATTVTNSLGANVALNNTATYFDGPSTAQGTTGTWFASGNVTVTDSGALAFFDCKLWDGTTVIDSTEHNTAGAGGFANLALSGVITSPAANIRISCKDRSQTTGSMVFNQSGNSKDSTLTVYRIQ